MAMRPYGVVGTTEVVYAEDWNQPAGTILLVTGDSPGPGYLIDETGNWSYPANIEAVKESIRIARKDAYLKAWPVDKQMEAIGDHLAGDSTKFDLMQVAFDKIKEDFPYPTQLEVLPKKSLGLKIKKSTD
jgi:hypothetical protein